MRKCLDLSRGGPSWDGWTFGPWGKSKEWWILDPNGTRYCASEIAELRAMALNLDYLQVRVRQLEERERELLAKLDRRFSASEVAILRSAAAILREASETPIQQGEKRRSYGDDYPYPDSKSQARA